METVILIFGALIFGAFAVRVIIASMSIIYKIAPWIILCLLSIALMYIFDNGDFQKILDMKDNNATVTRTTEN